MKIPVPALLEATSAICLVPSRAGIMSSEFIKLRSDKKSLKMSLAAEIYGTTVAKAIEPGQKPWTFYVDRASFEPFVQASHNLGQKAPFVFSITDDEKPQLIVSCGSRKAIFQEVQQIQGYSDKMDFEGRVLNLSSQQKASLRLASKYATIDPTFAHLNCVYLLKGKSIVASNQLSAIIIDDPVVPMSVPLPLLLLSILDDDQVKSIVVSPAFAKVTTPVGILCQLTSTKAAAEFPIKTILKNMKKAKAEFPQRFVLKASSLLAALKRLEAYVATIVRRDMTVTVSGKKGEQKIKLVASIPSGRFEEPVKVEAPGLSEDINFELLLATLLPLNDVSIEMGKVSVSYTDESPFYFTSKGMQLLVSRKA